MLHFVEHHLDPHGNRHHEHNHAPDDEARVVALLLQRVEVWVGAPVVWERHDLRLRLGPVWGVVILAVILLQFPAGLWAAEAVVAGSTAVDEGVLGAVEGRIEVSHHVVVASTYIRPAVHHLKRRHLGCA